MEYEVVLDSRHIGVILVLVIALSIGVSASDVSVLSSPEGEPQGHPIQEIDFSVCSIEESNSDTVHCGWGKTAVFGGCKGDDISRSYPSDDYNSWSCASSGGSIDTSMALCCGIEPQGAMRFPLSIQLDADDDAIEGEDLEFNAWVDRSDGKDLTLSDFEDYRTVLRDDNCAPDHSGDPLLSLGSGDLDFDCSGDSCDTADPETMSMDVDSDEEYNLCWEVLPDGSDKYYSSGQLVTVDACREEGDSCDSDSECCNDDCIEGTCGSSGMN
ncbi:MAG: hypothetical protein ACLFQ8_01060 [Candidatus Aenigmatarchaeota archaeon]